jgi:CRP-like cAMP-binding protein
MNREVTMVDVQDLKGFVMLGYLSEEMLKRLSPITRVVEFEKNEMVFNQGSNADCLFLVKKGKVLLEQRISDTMTIFLSSIKPGFSFGWSAMLDKECYSSDAICTQPSTLYSFRAFELKQLMDEDHSMGFIISQRLLYVMKKRYDVRTQQFLKTIQYHPEISELL